MKKVGVKLKIRYQVILIFVESYHFNPLCTLQHWSKSVPFLYSTLVFELVQKCAIPVVDTRFRRLNLLKTPASFGGTDPIL